MDIVKRNATGIFAAWSLLLGSLLAWEIFAQPARPRYFAVDIAFHILLWVLGAAAIVVSAVRLRERREDRRAYEDALRHRVDLEKLASTISAKFINLPASRVPGRVNQSLGAVGRQVGADRCFFYRIDENNPDRLAEAYEWCADGVRSSVPDVLAIALDKLPLVRRLLERQEVVRIDDVQSMPGAWRRERHLLELFGEQSIVLIPQTLQGVLVGGVGITGVHRRRTWSDEDIALVGTIGNIIVNALERKRSIESLTLERNFVSTVFDTLGALLVVFDRGGRVVRFNRACEAVTGRKEAEVVGEYVWDLFVDPVEREQVRAAARQMAASTAPMAVENDWIKIDGRPRRVAWSSTVITDRAGRVEYVIANGVDVTDWRREEEERRKLEGRIHHAQRLESLAMLAGGVAHDFNNLLTGILGNASLATARLAGPAAGGVAANLQAIERTAQRAADLANQMLAYSGRGSFEVEPVNLSEIVEDVTGLVGVSISKRAELRFALDRNLPAFTADPTQIRQVVLNLMTNASDALGDQPGTITVRTGEIGCTEEDLASAIVGDAMTPGPAVYLEVADTGYGMDAATVERIFDPFFTTKFTGKGLGLAAVLGIVRGHGGAIKVFSEPGRGSLFTVFFPTGAEPVPATPVPGYEPLPALDTEDGLVLVVDDEEEVRETARRILEHAGYRVETAAGGEEALDVYDKRGGDVRAVLLDMTMPRMDGEETFRELRRRHPGARVVLTSGFSKNEATRRFAGRGLAGFLQKPYRADTLVREIRRAVDPPGPDGD